MIRPLRRLCLSLPLAGLGMALSLACFAAPTDLAPSAAQAEAFKIIASWKCTPLPGVKMESQGAWISKDVVRDPKAPMALAMAGVCDKNKGAGAPNGGTIVVVSQDKAGKLSVSDAFESVSSIKLNPDASVTVVGMLPKQKEVDTATYQPSAGKLIKR